MYASDTKFVDPAFGPCVRSVVLHDEGAADITFVLGEGTPAELRSTLTVPKGWLLPLLLDVTKLVNMERRRAGDSELPDVFPEEDDDGEG